MHIRTIFPLVRNPRQLLHAFQRSLRRRLARLLLGRFSFGRPMSKALWEQQYREGYWNFLSSPDELDHYLAIVEMIAKRGRGLRILDVGCGYGRLLELLDPTSFSRYVGIDLSSAAIERASAAGIRDAEFIVADFQTWTPEETFDVIVFNESLYYAARPAQVARRYGRFVAPGGTLIASLVDYGNHASIWRRLDRNFTVGETRVVTNRQRQRWTIKALSALQ
jgi:SAM-dependent methyltransferase